MTGTGALNPIAPTRVLFLTTSLKTVGPAGALVSIATALDPRRFTAVFCHFDSAEESTGAWRDRLAERSVRVYALNARGAFDARALARLCRILRRESIDVLHTRLIRADFYGRIAGRLCGVPVVITNLSGMYTRHFESWHGRLLGRLLYWIDRRTLRWAHVIVANSRGVARDVQESAGVPPERVVQIYNSIDHAPYAPSPERRRLARERLGIPQGVFTIGYIGRLMPSKALDDLLDASRELGQDIPDLTVLVAGDGPARSALEASAARLDLSRRVRFLGHRTDVPDVLAALDAFVFPSVHEGHPNSVLEAMAAGLPIVATAIPGTDELIEDGRTGLLVPVRDPAAIAERVRRLANDPAMRASLGEHARAVITSSFGVSNMVRRFETVYESALEQRMRPAV